MFILNFPILWDTNGQNARRKKSKDEEVQGGGRLNKTSRYGEKTEKGEIRGGGRDEGPWRMSVDVDVRRGR